MVHWLSSRRRCRFIADVFVTERDSVRLLKIVEAAGRIVWRSSEGGRKAAVQVKEVSWNISRQLLFLNEAGSRYIIGYRFELNLEKYCFVKSIFVHTKIIVIVFLLKKGEIYIVLQHLLYFLILVLGLQSVWLTCHTLYYQLQCWLIDWFTYLFIYLTINQRRVYLQ